MNWITNFLEKLEKILASVKAMMAKKNDSEPLGLPQAQENLRPEMLDQDESIPDEYKKQEVIKSQSMIEWVESEDVFKPTEKPIQEFIRERNITPQYPKVYILEDALKNLIEHLQSNLRVEQGGILFGNAYTDPTFGIYVEVTAAVPAPATIGTGASLEFTPDSWVGIMNHAKATHPEANIIGWYHSHPDIGVFMSGTDMRTQRSFFPHPWCLSIVYDPVQNKIGYFLGEKAQKVQPNLFKTQDTRPEAVKSDTN
ncbi:MAG: Mov34/MPN/PAD-1 family protein [Planktothrix sp.]|uniref:Mov34/MPN/PAD-1 family protein n=1 Tax=Planktothrix sp. TaxID=3088171 RepID=UPI0038D4A972